MRTCISGRTAHFDLFLLKIYTLIINLSQFNIQLVVIFKYFQHVVAHDHRLCQEDPRLRLGLWRTLGAMSKDWVGQQWGE